MMIFQDGMASVGDVQLFYKAGGSGSPVIVLHGGPGMDHHSFLPQFERLADRHHLVLYDQRACGRSTGYPYEATTRLSVYVSDLEGLRNKLSLQQVSIIGVSFGGLLAMSYAIAHPASVSRLVLLDSVPGRDSDDADFGAILQSRTPPEEQSELDRLRNSQELARGSGAMLNKWLRLRFRAYFFDETKLSRLKLNFTDATAVNYVRVADLLGQDSDGYDLSTSLSQLNCPTLILQGDYDPITPNMMVRTRDTIPNCQLEVVRDAGHFSYVEQPEVVFDRLTQFLASSAAPLG
jgi:proline iminopeptidase